MCVCCTMFMKLKCWKPKDNEEKLISKLQVRFQMLLRWCTLPYDESQLPSWPSRKMLQFVYWKCELGMLKNENLN